MSITRIDKAEEDYIVTLGKRLCELRKAEGCSQNDIAATAKCGKNHISEVEQGKSRLTVYQLRAYWRKLHMSPNKVLGYDGVEDCSETEIEIIDIVKSMDEDQKEALLKQLKENK